MSTTLLYSNDAVPVVSGNLQTIITSLNITSTITSAVTVALALLCQTRVYTTRNNKLRSRVVMALSISAACQSIAQLVLTGQAKHQTNFLGTRILVFVASFSTVLNSLLVASAISIDAAIRYGLRSFQLALKLGNYYEVFCIVLALAVSQPILYLFGQFVWTGNAIVVAIDRTAFTVAMWMVESAWVALSLSVSFVATVFALVKARKIAKYTGNSTRMAFRSVLGSAATIKGHVGISVLYSAVISGCFIWKLAFRAEGSQSQWLLSASCIGEALQGILILVAFVVDMATNIIPERRVEWLNASTVFVANAGENKKLDMSSNSSSNFRLESTSSGGSSESFTGWRQTQFIEWQHMGNSYQQSYEKSAPSDEDIKLWAKEIQRCHLKPETCFYEGDDSSVSDLSSIDSVPSRYSGSVVLYPLTN